MSWSAKWLYDDKILSDVLTPKEAKERNDKRIIKSVWKLLNEADIVIAHNGDKFDLKKLKARFLSNGFVPPMPYKTVDTLKDIVTEVTSVFNQLQSLIGNMGVPFVPLNAAAIAANTKLEAIKNTLDQLKSKQNFTV